MIDKKHLLEGPIELTVLCENSVLPINGLLGEHGWSLGIETLHNRLLFDTGQGRGLVGNSEILGFDLKGIDTVVLSHGHYDHCSGVTAVLERASEVQIRAHPDVFIRRFHRGNDSEREIGCGYTRKYIESMGAKLIVDRKPSWIAPGVWLSGEIERTCDFEHNDHRLHRLTRSSALEPDPLIDDQSLVIHHRMGLIVILGCAHAGLINILTHVRKHFPDQTIHTVIGGTHLGFLSEEQFQATVTALADFSISCLAPTHCTGLKRICRLAAVFGPMVRFAPVGTRLKIE